VIRSLLQYSRFFARGLARPGVRRLLYAHAQGVPQVAGDHGGALHAVADHFLRARRHSADGGLGSFHLIHGWGASYPETTGYIIPTLFALSDRLARPELEECALGAAQWLLDIQRADGGWQGGRVNEDRPSIVFNTAQVVRGMLASHARTGSQRHLDAAVRAGEWMVRAQEPDGSWKRHNFLGRARVYDTYVCAPLLQLHTATGMEPFRRAARQNLEWVVTRRHANGWFADADNTVHRNHTPITHTVAYTLDGLLECDKHLPELRLRELAAPALDVLLGKFLADGRLDGRYDDRWRGSEATITTGNAQLAIAWARLHQLDGDNRKREGVHRMAQLLKGIQQLSNVGPEGGHGAVTGSFPLWGRYEKFAFPNWAQKYFADALLCDEGQLPAH
jgi:hypothetical protein